MSEKRQVSNTKLVLVAMGAVMLMISSAVVSNSTSYFITSVTEELNISRAAFSVYYTIISITTAIGSVLCGTLIPKLGNRKAFLVGTVGVTIGFLIMSRLTSLTMVYAGAAFIGFCQAFIVVPPVSVVNTWFPKERQWTGHGTYDGRNRNGRSCHGSGYAKSCSKCKLENRISFVCQPVMFCVLTLVRNALCGSAVPEAEGAAVKTEKKKKEKLDMSKVLSVAFIFMVLGCMSKCFSAVFNRAFTPHNLQESFSTDQIALAMTVFNIVLIIMNHLLWEQFMKS